MRKTIGLLLGAIILSVSACTGIMPRPASKVGVTVGASDEPLNEWVKNQLTPYLVQQLGKHPKFKGESFLLIRIQGDDVQAEIDDLTGHIRERVMDGLLAEPGINLVWRPAVKPWQHHQSLEDLNCAEYRKIRYYVCIDTGLTKVDGRLYVKVRALNLEEGAWVSGFGMSWTGSPTKRQVAALGRTHTDEYLRGLRPLPFMGAEPDLLASYLAHNLSCLFKQREIDNVIVYVDKKGSGQRVFFKTVLDLVANYLARFREVRVTQDPEQANVTIKTDIHPIHGGLYQVWVSALYKDGDQYVPGTETEAYVRMGTDGAIAAKPQPQTARRASAPVERARKSRSLIESFGLLTPISQAFCSTDTPWILGERYLTDGAHLSTGGCVAVSVSVAAPARIYLIGQNPQGHLTRLFPSQCHGFAILNNRIQTGEPFRFPPLSGAGPRALIIEDAPGTEHVYAIAIADAEMARRFESRIEGIAGLCDEGETGKITGDQNPFVWWRRYLDTMVEEGRGAFKWRMRWFQHDAKEY